MTVRRDPTALLRHALQVGDVRLAELVRQRLCDDPPTNSVAPRTYTMLVVVLQLDHGAPPRHSDD